MDQELKSYLDTKVSAIDERFAGVDGQFADIRASMQHLEDRSAALLAAEVGNLHNEIQDLDRKIYRISTAE